MTKRHIFKTAHKIAKEIVREVGDYQIALSIALKEIYRQIKLYNKKRFGQEAVYNAIYRLTTSKEERYIINNYTSGIPNWFLTQNLSSQEYYAVQMAGPGDVYQVKETEKAVRLCFIAEGYGTATLWVPKSLYKVEYSHVM